MNIVFSSHAWEDFEFWLEHDPGIADKVRELLREIRRSPFHGMGKPEPLRFDLKGYWSRRITGEHRLVYKIEGTKGRNQSCMILQCRFHYD